MQNLITDLFIHTIATDARARQAQSIYEKEQSRIARRGYARRLRDILVLVEREVAFTEDGIEAQNQIRDLIHELEGGK